MSNRVAQQSDALATGFDNRFRLFICARLYQLTSELGQPFRDSVYRMARATVDGLVSAYLGRALEDNQRVAAPKAPAPVAKRTD